MNADMLQQLQQTELQRQGHFKDRLLCCTAAGCLSGGAREVREALTAAKPEDVEVCGTGCLGWCSRGPLVKSTARDCVYTNVAPSDADSILKGELEGRVVTPEHPFYAGQHRLILSNSGKCDPERIQDYIAQGGYRGLLRAVTDMTPS